MKLSIVTIAYNCKTQIQRTMDSVILQDHFDDIEYIVIDGGSNDGTVDIINKYKEYLDYFISEQDNGISDAFNKGIKIATGDFIGLINSGDILLPGVVEKLKEIFPNNYDVIYGNSVVYDVNNHLRYYRLCMPLEKMKYELPFIHQSCFISKKAYEKYGYYNLRYKICMDYNLLSKMYLLNARFRYLPVEIAEFSYGGVSSTNHLDTLKERLEIALHNGGNLVPQLIFNTRVLTRIYIKQILVSLGIWKFISNIIHKKR